MHRFLLSGNAERFCEPTMNPVVHNPVLQVIAGAGKWEENQKRKQDTLIQWCGVGITVLVS